MPANLDLVLHGGTVVTPWGKVAASIGVRAGKTMEIGNVGAGQGAQAINSQVHIRGPSPTHAAVLRALELKPGAAGMKVFVGSSTGNLRVDDDEHVGQVAGEPIRFLEAL